MVIWSSPLRWHVKEKAGEECRKENLMNDHVPFSPGVAIRSVRPAGEVVVPTLCGACHNNCGILVHVVDGKIRRIEGNPDHPFNRGTLCPKGPCMHELVSSPHRIQRPLLRAGERGERKWKEISWDEALDLMAAKLTEIREKYGPETLLKSTGAPVMEFQRWGLIEFFAQYGTPNVFSSNLCSATSAMALESVYGFKSQPDYGATNLIIMWGGNPWASMRPGHNIAYDEGRLSQPDSQRHEARSQVHCHRSRLHRDGRQGRLVDSAPAGNGRGAGPGHASHHHQRPLV